MSYCPVCENEIDSFLPAGVSERLDVKCPICRTRERYRLLVLYLKNETDFFTRGGRVLEIGPAKGFSERIKGTSGIEYTSIDLFNDAADLKMDITDMKFDDNTFDYIICYHVLEHIPDDHKAIQELSRILKPEGLCLIAAPVDINRKETFEKEQQPKTDKEREKLYGQKDHVRIYGTDFLQRLEKAGLKVKVEKYVEKFSLAERKKFGLKDRYKLLLFETNEDMYICRKQ